MNTLAVVHSQVYLTGSTIDDFYHVVGNIIGQAFTGLARLLLLAHDMILRFQYSDLKQLLLKAYILTRFWVFLFTFANRLIKYEKQTFLCGGVVLEVLNLYTPKI